MKVLLEIALAAVVVGSSAFGNGIATVEINGNEFTNVNEVHVSANGQIFVSATNGMTTISANKLPEDFLKSWNINIESAKATEKLKADEQLDKAIAAGYFREADGVVYNIRKPQSGWVIFYNAKVVQILDDGSAILDTTPDEIYAQHVAVHVRNLPGTISDTDVINFYAKPVGTYSYVNKLDDDRTIRDYNAGRVCSHDEIPDSVLSGRKAFDIMVQNGTPSKDVIATLPESDDLQASGSGFFITEDGYLITNFHVVKDAKRVKVKSSSGVYSAEVVHADRDNDLALLKVSGKFNFLSVSKEDAQLGEAVFTIGFPNIVVQGTEPKYTDGKISSLAGIRDDPRNYQISVPVQPGNSGGPLVDMSGNVVGVIVAKLNDIAALSSSGNLPQNVNYAIKGKYLNDFLGQFSEIKLNSTKPVSSENVVQSAQQSVAMVLVY